MSESEQQDTVIFVSKYSQLSIDPPRQREKQVQGGDVVTVSVRGQDIEFRDGRFSTDDPAIIEHLRSHHRYAKPGEGMDDRVRVFTEVATDEEADEATSRIEGSTVRMANGEEIPVSDLVAAYRKQQAADEESGEPDGFGSPEPIENGTHEAGLADLATPEPSAQEGELTPLYLPSGDEVTNKQEALEALEAEDARPTGINLNDSKKDIIAVAHEQGYFYPGYE